MSDKKCCVPGCSVVVGLHRFPNPNKERERFDHWINVIGGSILSLDHEFIHKYRRVCNTHFDEEYLCRNNRLSKSAIPTLMMPGLHRFPNPNKERERFDHWINVIGGSILSLDHEFIHKYRRVCNTHFDEEYLCRNNRLSKSAIPTLMMPDSFLTEIGRPMRELQNLPEYFSSSSQGLLPSYTTDETPSRQFQYLVQSLPSTSQGPSDIEAIKDNCPGSQSQSIREEEKYDTCVTIPSTRKCIKRSAVLTPAEQTLYKKLKTVQAKLYKCRNRVKKQFNAIKMAKKMMLNPNHMKVLGNMPSASRILTLLQCRENKKKEKGRRFQMDEKILALSIFKQIPKAYRFLRKLLILPAPQTLMKLISQVNIRPGINIKIFNQLKKEAENMKPTDRLCVLLFDEMSLKPDVTYNERKDKIIGFVTDGQQTRLDYADHAQVFMIRGLIKKFKQPISYTFSSTATKGPELAKQIKEIVGELQKAGMIVAATMCDQGTNNRSAIKILLQEAKAHALRHGRELKNNVLCINNQEIVPLYDPPHLIKCVRNNLLTKNLKYDTCKLAKWNHLELLLKENPGYRGMRLIPKISTYHIENNKIPKMKVKYATQIFSQTVGRTMGYLADKCILPIECKETADILLFFDELFDSMNGSFNKKNVHGKPLLGPVTPNSVHHKFWLDAKRKLKSMNFINKSNNNVETVPTLNNWVWTLDGVQTLLKKLHQDYDVTSVWMRHLNQDPIENIFGAIRSHGCGNINPSPEKFENAFTTLLINNLSSVHALGSNCERDLCNNLYALIITDDSKDETTCNLSNVPNVNLLSLEDKNNPRILAPLQYVSGYFLHQAKRKVFKSCMQCKKDLCSTENIEYIKYREYAGRRWLCYPNIKLIEIISNIQDVTYEILKSNLYVNHIKYFIKTIIVMFLDFNFIYCQVHKEDLINFLINITCRFFIFNHCKNLNKILTGRKDCEDDDIFQLKAKQQFTKFIKKSKK